MGINISPMLGIKRKNAAGRTGALLVVIVLVQLSIAASKLRGTTALTWC